jgi:hypothetical protein
MASAARKGPRICSTARETVRKIASVDYSDPRAGESPF